MHLMLAQLIILLTISQYSVAEQFSSQRLSQGTDKKVSLQHNLPATGSSLQERILYKYPDQPKPPPAADWNSDAITAEHLTNEPSPPVKQKRGWFGRSKQKQPTGQKTPATSPAVSTTVAQSKLISFLAKTVQIPTAIVTGSLGCIPKLTNILHHLGLRSKRASTWNLLNQSANQDCINKVRSFSMYCYHPVILAAGFSPMVGPIVNHICQMVQSMASELNQIIYMMELIHKDEIRKSEHEHNLPDQSPSSN